MIKNTPSFSWVDFEDLLASPQEYHGKKVQGIAEIVEYLGVDRFQALTSESPVLPNELITVALNDHQSI
jgi:hypothetical protein